MLYFPLLRTKQGELNALASLPSPSKQAMCPILQVPPPDMVDDAEVPPSSAFVAKVATSLRGVLTPGNGLSCFLDPAFADLTPTLLEELLTKIATYGGTPQPVYNLTGSGQHATLQERIIGIPPNAIIRVNINELNATLPSQLTTALTQYNLRASQAFLLLDMGDISIPNLPINIYEDAFTKAINAVAGMDLAGIIVASCALPVTPVPALVKWVPVQFVRHELTVFRNIKAATGQDIHFSDYATGNIITGPSPSRQGAPKVRYTGATSYEVMRGEKTAGPPLTMSEQYNRLSQHIVGHSTYKGRMFSWGDDYIHQASQPGPSSTKRGNPAKWVEVHTSHHLELVVSMLPSM